MRRVEGRRGQRSLDIGILEDFVAPERDVTVGRNGRDKADDEARDAASQAASRAGSGADIAEL